jgi:peptidoglycan/xylan/chitin deacetylase (PgdA/CDA1 family)
MPHNGTMLDRGSSTRTRRAQAVFVAVLVGLLLSVRPFIGDLHHAAPTFAVPILMYHHIGDWGPSNPGWSDWVVKPADFSAQLDWLKREGYSTLTFRDILALQDRRVPLPQKSVVITFDDGWAYQGVVAKAELDPRGMRAVFFVYTGAIGATPNGSGYISWEELRELEGHGHEVQSHTIGHPRLVDLSTPVLAHELAQSRLIIERQVGHPVRVLAYPFGIHDERVLAATQEAGYDLAVRADDSNSVLPHKNFHLPRIRMGYQDGIEIFAAHMRSFEQAR